MVLGESPLSFEIMLLAAAKLHGLSHHMDVSYFSTLPFIYTKKIGNVSLH